MTHHLKSWPRNFAAVLTGRKRFEVRKDDRSPPFEPGHEVLLLEWEPRSREDSDMIGQPHGFTGRKALYFVGHVDRGSPLPAGWCAFDLISVEDYNRIMVTKAGVS